MTGALAEYGGTVLRILDLGCGSGRDLAAWGVADLDEVIGLDINLSAEGGRPCRVAPERHGEVKGQKLASLSARISVWTSAIDRG